MKLAAAKIEGLRILETPRHHDVRGFFSRTFDAEWMAGQGAPFPVHQTGISQNVEAGTVRGMHWQAPPYADAKVVRCIKGRIYDVVADVRPGSPTYRRWQGFTLDASEDVSLVIPAGVAHGFQTLADDSEILYLIGAPYRAELSRGVRFDDPALGIVWPLPVSVISDRDRALPVLAP